MISLLCSVLPGHSASDCFFASVLPNHQASIMRMFFKDAEGDLASVTSECILSSKQGASLPSIGVNVFPYSYASLSLMVVNCVIFILPSYSSLFFDSVNYDHSIGVGADASQCDGF